MGPSAIFPHARHAQGLYESFYLRAVHPRRRLGVWIRYTAHKRPDAGPRGALWFTLFDADEPAPFQHKTWGELSLPHGAWIGVGDAVIGPVRAAGHCGPAQWSLSISARAPELRHLAPAWLYRTPLPRTKLTSPMPLARLSGTVRIDGVRDVELDGWHGMVGHNWGAEHAERWIWLHGVDLAGSPDAWLDLALGRMLLGRRQTPWAASGALTLDGERHRLGGLAARVRVAERPDGCRVEIARARGPRVHVQASAPAGSTAGWRYADPDGSPHDVANCSVCELTLTASTRGTAARRLHTYAGGAYELGMRERDHGVAIAPFADGEG